MVEAIQYFNFPNANEALDFYEENFDAVITSKVLASDPMFEDGLEEMGMSQEDAESFIMNAEFEVLGQKFMVSTTWEKKEIDNSGANVTFVFNTSNQEDYDTVKQSKQDVSLIWKKNQQNGRNTLPVLKIHLVSRGLSAMNNNT